MAKFIALMTLIKTTDKICEYIFPRIRSKTVILKLAKFNNYTV